MILRKLDDQPVETNISMCEGLFVKHAIFDDGAFIPQHSHAHEHLTIIATGAVRVWANDVLLGDFHAPAGIVIKARVQHLFQALEPKTTVLCIHRVDENGDPKVIDEPHFVRYEET